jgi:hypothetical protein
MKIDQPDGFTSSAYDTICDKFTDGGLVDYQLLKNSPLLDQALYDLARTGTDKMTDPKAQLAFWIDAYNLIVVRDIASKFPVKTLREVQIDISSRRFLVANYPYSAQEIFEAKIRPLLQTLMPKAVFLTCGGSLGYPKFPGHLITARILEGESERATIEFINDPQNVSYDGNANVFHISQFFKWNEYLFQKLYGGPEGLVKAYMKPLTLPGVNANIALWTPMSFNWRINNLY